MAGGILCSSMSDHGQQMEAHSRPRSQASHRQSAHGTHTAHYATRSLPTVPATPSPHGTHILTSRLSAAHAMSKPLAATATATTSIVEVDLDSNDGIGALPRGGARPGAKRTRRRAAPAGGAGGGRGAAGYGMRAPKRVSTAERRPATRLLQVVS